MLRGAALALTAAATMLTSTIQAPTASAQDPIGSVAGALGGQELITAHEWAKDGVTPLVVFGARLDPGCVPPGILNVRMNRAMMFSWIHPNNPIIVTGGFTREGCLSEAAAMERGLRMRGVRNPIIVEEHSYSTYENARNVAAINPSPRFIIVSNSWHEDRARDNMRSLGRDAVALNFFE